MTHVEIGTIVRKTAQKRRYTPRRSTCDGQLAKISLCAFARSTAAAQKPRQAVGFSPRGLTNGPVMDRLQACTVQQQIAERGSDQPETRGIFRQEPREISQLNTVNTCRHTPCAPQSSRQIQQPGRRGFMCRSGQFGAISKRQRSFQTGTNVSASSPTLPQHAMIRKPISYNPRAVCHLRQSEPRGL